MMGHIELELREKIIERGDNMELWSYPIGNFIPEVQPTTEHRQGWIANIAQMPKLLRFTVQNLTAEQLLTPYRPGGWNTQQVVHHLADNNMNAYLRFKRALTEDAPLSGTYREDLWAELIDYQEAPIETSLLLLDSLHQRFVILLRSLSSEQFQRNFESPTHGKMSLDNATQRYDWHGRHHIAQIESLIGRI